MNASFIIGNDIVDWNKAKQHSHKLRPRSLEKIFNTNDIEYINKNNDSLLAYWHLWSVKESAYKAWQRLNEAEPIFNPKSFVCSGIQSDSVIVEKDDFRCKVKTSYAKGYIYSRCHSEKLQSKIFDSQDSYNLWLIMMTENNWIVKKSLFNIPSFYNTSSQQRIPVSISHDGNYVAVDW